MKSKSNAKEKFFYASLFAGCGGSSCGYRMAGGKGLLAVEWDDNAAETYALNFPHTPLYHGDIAKLSVKRALEMMQLAPGDLDILDGSPPCQGFSISGKRFMDDPRNSLFKEYVRLVRGIKPKTFVMENVAGLLRGKMGIIFADILRELKASGYKVKCQLVNVKWLGVPQSRERTIFIGVRNDLGLEPVFPKPCARPVTVREALRGVPSGGEIEIWNPDTKAYWAGRLTPQGKTSEAVFGEGHWFNHRRLDWDKPCPTISKKCDTLYHPDRATPLTIPELKRLSSFPDDFQFIGNWRQQSARIGNAVPPLLAKAIGETLLEHVLMRAAHG